MQSDASRRGWGCRDDRLSGLLLSVEQADSVKRIFRNL